MRPVAQPIYSAAIMIIGAALLTNPEDFPAGPYTYTFSLMRPEWWGVLFLVVGATAFGAFTAPDWNRATHIQRVLASLVVAAQCALLVTWALFLTAAALDPALSVSVAGPTMWLAASIVNGASLWRYSHGRPRD